MKISTGFKRSGAAVIVASGLVLGGFIANPAFAQDATPEHVAAARTAIAALGATDQFDAILPNAAEQLKASLIQSTPDLQEEISATVDEKVYDLVPRRGDLEREAAAIYAKTFSEADLKAIADFYSSDAGKHLIENGPLVTRELLKAAEIWSNGIQRDLSTEVATALQAKLGDRTKLIKPATEGADAPADTAPPTLVAPKP
ncbi:hypothetical protein DFR52_1011161 [Hoeflea marina]|uniref:DUF2059 domain-containing protein n=1 Tax=Hoeflea marina TaxID=274592 RepID=A0A317PSM2_9HYPH|nr:DUF2059 domain-containing protein [Hoeflea marina]PWW04463.1 hypothetical protein DFR52_1011161 [Hoeflea marina]